MQKIKSITTFLTSEEYGEGETLHMKEVRDEQENILVHESFAMDGSRQQRTVNTYNDQGLLIAQDQYTYGEEPDQRLVFAYNESGKLAEVTITYMDGSISVKTYDRNEAENSLTIVIRDEDGEEEGKEYRKLDSEGRVLEEIIHEDGELNSQVKASYDDAGRPVEKHTVDAEGYEQSHFYFYELNEKGQFSEIEIADEKDELIRADSFEYDERGNEITHRIENHKEGYVLIDHQIWDADDQLTQRRRVLSDGKLIEEINYEYNEMKLLAKEEHISADQVYAHRYEYEFF